MDALQEWAAKRPLFTLNDVERTFEMKRESLREKLSRMTKRNDVYRIERGKYTVHDDPLIYATYIEIPSFVSLWTGLRFYNLTTQQPTRIQVIAATNRSDIDTITFYSSRRMFGFGKHWYNGFEIFVADKERLLVDCLARKQVPVDNLKELLEEIDPDTAADYAERFGKTAVKKRVGYLLEHVRGVSIDELRSADRNYPKLDLTRPSTGEPDQRWRITVNTDVI